VRVTDASDDLVTKLADVIGKAVWNTGSWDEEAVDAARAVLEHRDLVVPTSDVLNLAQQWDDEPGDPCTGPEYYSGLGRAAAELRARIRQETPLSTDAPNPREADCTDLVTHTDQWQWGIKHTAEDGAVEGPYGSLGEAVSRNYAAHPDCTLARRCRRPDGQWGEWEVVAS
jgi:hypothetical protein